MKKLIIFFLLTALSINAFNQSKINIGIDPRIELLSVMLAISDYDSIMVSMGSFHPVTQFDFDYRNDLMERFEKHSNADVINTFMSMARDYGFFFSMPVDACLNSSTYPDMKADMMVPEMLVNRSGGIDNMNLFLAQLSDFGKDIRFKSFMKSHRDYYDKITSTVRNYGIDQYVNHIEDYYGMEKASYNIILVSMFHPGGYGPNTTDSLGNNNIYSVNGPKSIENGMPKFGSEEGFRYVVWHEFSHSFVNNLVNKYYPELEKSSFLMDKISDKMKVQMISDWEDCLAEHIVRAVTVRLSYLHQGREAGDKAMELETGMGFEYVPALCSLLESYESNRGTYTSFGEFLPVIVDYFTQEAEDQRSFVTISGVVSDYKGKPLDSVNIEVKSSDFETLFKTCSDKNGRYSMKVKKGSYTGMLAVKTSEYPSAGTKTPPADQRLEFWYWNLQADRDQEIDIKYHRLEIYGLNAFIIPGACPGYTMYCRPMSLTRALSGTGSDISPEDIAPDPYDLDIKVEINNQPVDINLVQKVQEYVGNGRCYGYLISTDLPGQEVNNNEYDIIRVIMTDKSTNDKGEAVYRYDKQAYM